MITFQEGKIRFNYRIVGIVLDGGRVLLHRAETDDFWALPGGRAELLEPSRDTLKREMQEELGVEVSVGQLVWVVENFFESSAFSFHEVAFYFLMAFPSGCHLYTEEGPFEGDEGHIRLIFQWFRVDELEQVRLYPAFLRKSLASLPPSTEHIVHTD